MESKQSLRPSWPSIRFSRAAFSALCAAALLCLANPCDANPFVKANKEFTEAGKKKKYPHEPFLSEDCKSCHANRRNIQEMVWEEPKLCVSCHKGLDGSSRNQRRQRRRRRRQLQTETAKETVVEKNFHAAFLSEKCTHCHDPHGSDHEFQLRTDALSLCTSCHNPKDKAISTAHGGITKFERGCVRCHDAHASKNEKLIHEFKQHPPFADRACDACHEPPNKDGSARLSESLSETCLACHSDRAEAEGRKDHPHLYSSGIDCTQCHSGHVSRPDRMLVDDAWITCRNCHEDIKDIDHPNQGHPSFKLRGEDPLRPGRRFSCVTCHDPHDGKDPKMMRKPFFHLCVECHPK
jgi:predicted CXXCH cytochrome family protein